MKIHCMRAYILLLVCSEASAAFSPSFLSTSKDVIQKSSLSPLRRETDHETNLRMVKQEDDVDEKLAQQNRAKARVADWEREKEQQQKEINVLRKEKDQRETAINRLKFQLQEIKTAAEESERKREEAEKQVDEVNKESKAVRDINAYDYDSVKAAFKKEKKELKTKLRSATDDLNLAKLEAQKKLEKTQQDAEAEKKEMLKEINNLTEALTKTNTMIATAKKEMSSIASSSENAVFLKMEEIAKKDAEIKKLLNLKKEFEEEIQSLEVQCGMLNEALKQNEKQTLELKKQIDELKMESEIKRNEDQDLIGSIKEEFLMEKETLSDKLRSLSTELNRMKDDSETELQVVKNKSSQEKLKMETKVAEMQQKLNIAADKLQRAGKSVYEVRKAADKKVSDMEKDTAKYKSTMRNIASQEKKELKRQVWDLETRSERAKYDAITAKKEAEQLRRQVSSFEDQINLLEETHKGELYELEQKLIAEEMFYAKAKATSHTKMVGLVEAFRRKIDRKENKAIDTLEIAQQQLVKLFNLKPVRAPGNMQTLAQKNTDLSITISNAAAEMETAKKSFEAKVQALEESLSDTKKRADKDLIQKEEEYQQKMRDEAEKATAKRRELLLAKNKEIKEVKAEGARKRKELLTNKNKEIEQRKEEGIRNVEIVRSDLTEKLYASLDGEKRLENTLQQKNRLINKYEADQKSIRKLLKLIWKATKEKISSKRRSLAPKKFKKGKKTMQMKE